MQPSGDVRIGDIRLIAVHETQTRLDAPAFFADYAANVDEKFALARDLIDADRSFPVDFHAWVAIAPRRTIVVDTCNGNHKQRPAFPAGDRLTTPFLERLRAVGAAVDDVTDVVCTHLHFDHCGWNTTWDGERWIPTFPRATYHFSAVELAYWRARIDANERGFHEDGFVDSVLPVLAGATVETFDSSVDLAPGISIEPAPGHTPGHALVRVARGGETALIVGDALQSTLQRHFPHLNARADAQPAAAAATRGRILDEAQAIDALVLPAHFPFPYGFGGRAGSPGQAR